MSNINNNRNKGRVFKEIKHQLNDKIFAKEVRLVGDNVDTGIYTIREALNMARDLGLDLIQLSVSNNIAICKIQNYNKFLYDSEKSKKKQKSSPVKEIKLSPNIGEHDIEYRSKQAIQFLKDGSKVRLTLDFRGREIIYKDNAQIIMLKFLTMVEEHGSPESLPKLDGKKMLVFIKPK